MSCHVLSCLVLSCLVFSVPGLQDFDHLLSVVRRDGLPIKLRVELCVVRAWGRLRGLGRRVHLTHLQYTSTGEMLRMLLLPASLLHGSLLRMSLLTAARVAAHAVPSTALRGQLSTSCCVWPASCIAREADTTSGARDMSENPAETPGSSSNSCATSVAKPTNHTRGWELLGHTLAFSDACAMA